MPEDTDQLMARIERLEAELRELRSAVRAPVEPGAQPPDEAATAAIETGAVTTSRRRAVGALAAGAVGVIAAAVDSQSVAAATGDVMQTGAQNTFSSGTITTVLARGTVSGSYVNAAINLEDNNGFGGSLYGAWGNAYMWELGRDPLPSDARYPGILWHRSGNWWVSVAAGVWRQIAGPSFSTVGPAGPAGPQGPPGPSGTGGSGGFTPLPVPVRVYDTRPDKPEPGVKTPFALNGIREIDLTANGSGVPPTARAVQISYVVIYPQTGGYALAWPGGDPPNTSQVNYLGGGGDVRGACVAIGAANGRIRLLSTGGGDIAVDVYGYFS